ncbi:MAG: bifunctional UDP-N-acetylglucosamine diphosphorylase/glucosamine-1-phosphate N-acetyltransferase GlmU [Bryobacterales bacterium]|nr:bifunctional UDP-N-acetylglucosamine diphosphorylase/glucosamine-1-phosphate N-acetyltransferase GlmU [Bryobacterales bacterium]MBV9399712.1 bifunctional UDP-N-acetylglucosamine diphosphorylase/glucosamine-1-phosphate N-acetyltransferase GlmU [Bryobacterales bacterium]
MNLSIVILAAGLGTRMRSKHAKVLHRAGGLALVEHVVGAARELAAPERIVVVTGHQAEDVEALLRPQGVRFARQTEQKGTGHAMECCRSAAGANGLLMVLYGDTPLLSAETLMRLRDAQVESAGAATLITTVLDDPTGYGRVIVDPQGNVNEIVEQKDCNAEQRAVNVINSGIYCFRADVLWKHLSEVKPNPISGEYYLTDMARILRCHGQVVRALHIDDPTELLGINTRIELAEADTILRMRKARELMLSGVTIERPETVTIDPAVTCGQDTIIEPFVRLLGQTKIGDNCRIGTGAVLESTVVEDRVSIGPYTLVADSHIEAEASAGPFARLRMGAHVGLKARIGNFVELKKTHLGAGAKSQHLAYLGDAEIGAGTNIGAGTITCNYDGEKKHNTKIGKHAFIGSNATLVAPVEIASDSYIAAGSTITQDVPEGALSLGRARQATKPGWVAKRRAKKKTEPA